MKNIENKLAPICLFVYNRLDETIQTVEALKQNVLASQSKLFVFSDGAKNKNSLDKVNNVREYIKTITGFKSIEIFESKENKGLANSIIDGVTKVISEYGKVIVLEDDLITSPNFLNFMNQGLDGYEKNNKIFSISGYSMNLPSLKKNTKDYYLGYRASSWGWGTWLNEWETVDWEVKDYNRFNRNIIDKYRFMRGGSDMPLMLKKQMKGYIDSWAIRWCYAQFQKNKLTIYPTKSKIESIGFGENATHTKKTKRFDTYLDNGTQKEFRFDKNVEIDKVLINEFKKKFSILNRIKDRF